MTATDITTVSKFTEFSLSKGTWLMMIWGAQGGSFDPSSGHGAYSEAILKLDKQTTLFAYVGAKGKCGNQDFETGQYEGGKNSICGPSPCIGGAATFISTDPYGNNILLISGAGGGSGYYDGAEFFGGVGGPFAGDALGEATRVNPEDAKKVRGKGATSSRPGAGGVYVGADYHPAVNGTIGKYLKGGDGICSAAGSAGGGGSGYFGGGGGADLGGGGGGSSYASHDLYNVVLLGGDKTFRSPQNKVVIGNSGNGYIRIQPSDPFTLERNKVVFKCTNIINNNFIIYSLQYFVFTMNCLVLFV
ncbi:PE-PGRS protein, putative [Trichomonas vaginalis G3]|uniref:receptor protein-tyrosine kinase n=1 Tax=Trichomonas vaginalis (strain ATCC PRA-98 / G3) TaxID=412133 RepID=A2G0H0_TRIV3|nr:glycine-rich protein family [Trichomonas vaginalis G3]EAX89345.1 PE-PGRS protein, putative [Trichomonas vaginalis G3]KAI5553673.1 glycine-rich protein family [Trichomonas vaginalis G3]|eukprot:XP_001302275.1 PE-PGRS protein [Trichomonas vaginalis G3]